MVPTIKTRNNNLTSYFYVHEKTPSVHNIGSNDLANYMWTVKQQSLGQGLFIYVTM